jgi:hypothetical protein
MNWNWWLMQFLYALPDALPWIFGGLAGVGMVSFGPIGRAFVRRLKRGDVEAELLPAVLEELTLVRGELGEVLERLDYAERLVSRGHNAEVGPVLPVSLDVEERVQTPT